MTKQKKIERSSEERPQSGFSAELYNKAQNARLDELHDKHLAARMKGGESLSCAESLEMMLLGNEEHVRALNEPPLKRFNKIIEGKADYIIIRCSDARVHRTDSENDPLIGIHIYIAGNIVPSTLTASAKEIADVIRLVKPKGVIFVEGHCECGACKERGKWVASGMKDTGSKPLNNLLAEVADPNPTKNAQAQLAKLMNLKVGERVCAAILYDWKAGGIRIISEQSFSNIDQLVDQFNFRHRGADEDKHLAEKLEKQKPHAIVVGHNLLPYSLGTILHADQGEIFHTTGSENGLDDFDEGSVLYAIEHLGVRHMSFISPAIKGEEKETRAMFDRWESDLRNMTVNGEHVFARMIDSGELSLTRLSYDLGSGRLAAPNPL